MKYPEELRYTKDHEWARLEKDGTVTIGVTDHAQNSLGEVVFVDLPKVGRTLSPHEVFGVVESIKAVSDLFSPVGGTVMEINSVTGSDPGIVNRSPHGDGWLIRIKPTNPDSLGELMSSAQYAAHVSNLG